jgi:hypothetical protein
VNNDIEIYRSSNTGAATLIDAQGNRASVVGKPTEYGRMVFWDVSNVLLSGELYFWVCGDSTDPSRLVPRLAVPQGRLQGRRWWSVQLGPLLSKKTHASAPPSSTCSARPPLPAPCHPDCLLLPATSAWAGQYFVNTREAIKFYPEWTSFQELYQRATQSSKALEGALAGRTSFTYLLPSNDALKPAMQVCVHVSVCAHASLIEMTGVRVRDAA